MYGVIIFLWYRAAESCAWEYCPELLVSVVKTCMSEIQVTLITPQISVTITLINKFNYPHHHSALKPLILWKRHYLCGIWLQVSVIHYITSMHMQWNVAIVPLLDHSLTLNIWSGDLVAAILMRVIAITLIRWVTVIRVQEIVSIWMALTNFSRSHGYL